VTPAGRAVRVTALVIAAGLSYAAFAAILHKGWFTAGSNYDSMATVLLVASVVAEFAAGIVLIWLRPRNRSGLLLYVLGVAVAAWAVAIASSGSTARYGSTAVVAFRPLLFLVVLAWPIGRLTRADRTWLVIYSVALSACWMSWIPFDPADNDVAIAHLPRLSDALNSFGSNAVMPAGGIVVVISVVRRFRRLPATARVLARPALVAGVAAGAGDVLLLVIDRYFGQLADHAGGRTLLGGVLAIVDQGRFVLVPLLLGWAALRSRAAIPRSRLQSVEIGPAAAAVEDAIALAVGDDTVRVGYHRDGAGWFGRDGAPANLGGPGRHVTVVERAGSPVAAVEHDEALDDRPSTLEIAVAAVASSIEHDRLAALAQSRLREAYEARRTIVDVEDAARRRIERDLHDGAQQRLVGLALQASLAARTGDTDVSMLADGVAEARVELRELASGILPSLLVERGLGAAISTLAATTPLTVNMHLSVPASLPHEIAATAWFVVAEAIANVVKHANATTVRIDGGVSGGWLVVAVADDGGGGARAAASSGLRGLSERAGRCGGRVIVDSPSGEGTTVRLEVPVPA
jgi:signal transduction histidine kinase